MRQPAKDQKQNYCPAVSEFHYCRWLSCRNIPTILSDSRESYQNVQK